MSASDGATITVTVTFAGSGDAFGSGGRYQACIHLRGNGDTDPVLVDCGATSLSALKRLGLDPGEIAAVFVSSPMTASSLRSDGVGAGCHGRRAVRSDTLRRCRPVTSPRSSRSKRW